MKTIVHQCHRFYLVLAFLENTQDLGVGKFVRGQKQQRAYNLHIIFCPVVELFKEHILLPD